MAGFLKRVATDKASGERPSTVRAIAAAAVAGAAAAAITYKIVRS
jgi:hypothetical protein